MSDYDMDRQPWPMSDYAFARAKPYREGRSQGVYHLEVKEDGVRRMVGRLGHGPVVAFSHRPSSVSHVFEPAFIPSMLLPHDTVIDGELVLPGQPAAMVTNAIAEHGGSGLVLVVFAVLQLRGKPCLYNDYQEMRDKIEDVVRFAGSPLVRPSLYVGECVAPTMNHLDEVMTQPSCLGREGLMLKSDGYQNVFKYKVEETIDAVITGTKRGCGKYDLMIGAIKCSVRIDGTDEWFEIAAAGGMDDATRQAMTDMDREGTLKGRVVELRCQCVAKDRLRHPRFVRWRDDKSANDCVFSQLNNWRYKHGND